jgi:hypothetical protein
MKYIFLFLLANSILFSQEVNEMRVVGKGEFAPDELVDMNLKDFYDKKK